MEVVKKKAAARKRVRRTVLEKERKPGVRDIIGSIEKWNVSQKIAVIESGISKSEFEKVKQEVGLDYETLSHILGVTKATLHNKKGDEKFSSPVTERLMQLVDIYVLGFEVFGDKERFKHWVANPIRSIGDVAPMEYLKTYYGREEIKDIIGRIAWGIIS